ncbi:hypothetical protein [Cohnella sp. JJ-181]|uniref:hypothetical protein n=1 Tax=Cohnella rhizoplanae TaxID=2974897 RepID=UPI0022FFA8C2|nr:hypothetical protein [Cohnella sp. JJ-181]CAI6087196.1 hypothetical protein COHCIP112018_05385 [Cohnella sp. JJ-181]
MISYIERVENHQIFILLNAGIAQIDSILHIDNLDANAREGAERIQHVYHQIDFTLRNYDQALIPVNSLNNALSHIQNANNYLSNFHSNRQISYLNDANNYIDNFLNQIPFVLAPRSPEEVENFRESISSFRRSVAQHARNSDEQFKELVSENNKLSQTIKEMTAQINSEKQRIDTIVGQFQQQINTFQQQFSQAEEKRREAFNDEMEDWKKKFTKEMEDWKNEFDDERDRRLQTYTEIIDSLTNRNDEISQNFSEDNVRLQQSFRSESEGILNIIKSHKSQVEELVGAITDTGLASGYRAVAQDERKAKRFWRGITVGSMLLLIGFAVFIAFESYTTKINLVTLGAKIFGALSVGTLVAFAARQASLHGQAERANRKMELELKAIGPYLVGFEVKEILEIKRTMVDKFFGKEDLVPSGEEPSKGSLDVIKTALETVQQVAKK